MRVDPDRRFGTRECPSCGLDVAANHNQCPICGYDFPQTSARQRGLRTGGALVMLAILAYLLLRHVL